MKKRIASLILTAILGIGLMPNAFALSGYTFSGVTPDAPWSMTAGDPAVMDAYNRAINLANQHNAVVEQLNALDLTVNRVTGFVVKTNPYTIQYQNSKSEYVKVGNDYIQVTTYYHAVIDNPQDGTESNGYYSGFHVRSGSQLSENVNYIYYGSCGATFNQLYAQKQNLLSQYNAVAKELSVATDHVLEETTKAGGDFDDIYRPMFERYLEFAPGRPTVNGRRPSGAAHIDPVCGPTVFKVGCPAYATSDGRVGAIERDSLSRPILTATPVISNGSTMIPIRPLINGLTFNFDGLPSDDGTEITFDGATQTIDIVLGWGSYTPVCMQNIKIQLTIGSSTAYISNDYTLGYEPYEMDQPAQIINGKTMVPLRSIGEMLNCTVEWVQDGEYVVILPMSLEEFVDGFWHQLQYEKTIDGVKYYRTDYDVFFNGASYLVPESYESTKEYDSIGIHYRTIYFDGCEIEMRESTNDNFVGMSVQSYCEQNDLEPYIFSDGTTVENLFTTGRSLYYLSTEDGRVMAKTSLWFGHTWFLSAWADPETVEKYNGENSLDSSLMRPEYVQFLRSFSRPSAQG